MNEWSGRLRRQKLICLNLDHWTLRFRFGRAHSTAAQASNDWALSSLWPNATSATKKKRKTVLHRVLVYAPGSAESTPHDANGPGDMVLSEP